ncbi:MAG: hypothetical protein ABIP97_04145, partial [Chthoniobacterales bacterium]
MKITWITRIIGLLFIVGFVSSAWGRTISLHPEDIDMAATIVEEGPRHGWASYTTESAPGVFRNNPVLISMTHSFLIRYSLDKIPKGQRITNAELSLGVGGFSKSARLFIWRIVADWGVGVNNIYRMQRPKQLL